MLQQTTVAAVKPYYAAFLARWPTVDALARAKDSEVMAAWAGLGYYSRARNLVACARQVVERGGFPENESELRRLPGLGAYTAAAVAAIAFGQRAVVVDANVERVVARLFAIAEALPAARKAIRQKTDLLTPDWRAGDFAQAMMDLGATICTAREPRCTLCPLAEHCAGWRQGKPAGFPIRAAKRDRPVRRGHAYWIERGGAVWLERRPAESMLGSMLALPDDGWTVRHDGHGRKPLAGTYAPLGVVRHSFTHFTLELSVLRFVGNGVYAPERPGEWWPIQRIDRAGLPTLFAKAARLASARAGLKYTATQAEPDDSNQKDHQAQVPARAMAGHLAHDDSQHNQRKGEPVGPA